MESVKIKLSICVKLTFKETNVYVISILRSTVSAAP